MKTFFKVIGVILAIIGLLAVLVFGGCTILIKSTVDNIQEQSQADVYKGIELKLYNSNWVVNGKKYEPKLNEYEIILYMSKDDYKLYSVTDGKNDAFRKLYADIITGNGFTQNVQSNGHTCFINCSVTFKLTLDVDETPIHVTVYDETNNTSKTYSTDFKKDDYIEEYDEIIKENK